MADDLAARFSYETRKALHMFAAWPPGQTLELGKYGILDGDLFTPLGDITELLGIPVSPRPVGPKLQFNFKSTGVTEGKIAAKASAEGSSPIGSGKLATKVTFKTAGSAFFRTKDTVYHAVNNLGALNAAIMAAFANGTWQGEWALVHGFYLAAGTTIIISNEDNGSIELEGTATPGGALDLADASAKVEGRNSEKISFEILGRSGLTPLLSLSKIRPRNRILGLFGWSEKTIRPLLASTEAGSADQPHNDLNGLNPEISMELAEELKMEPDELFHMAELDGRLSS